MGSWLDGGHHEAVFGGDLLALASLLVLLVFLDIVLDLGEVHGHFLLPVGFTSVWSTHVPLDEVLGDLVRVFRTVTE